MTFVKDEANENQYSVVSVERTERPEGINEGSWYRYVVERRTSAIEGKMRGTLKEVIIHARSFADDLNSRTGMRGQSMWASRQKK